MTEPIEIVPYDAGWPAAFERERALIAPILGATARRIEHMGSTSIPGLAAKPIIDIVVLVDDLAVARAAIPALEATGYSFWREGAPHRLYLAKGLPPAPRRTHHLHIYDDEAVVHRHLLFRDAMRGDAEIRSAYLKLKEELAGRHRDDREAYTSGKDAFIDDVVRGLGGPARWPL